MTLSPRRLTLLALLVFSAVGCASETSLADQEALTSTSSEESAFDGKGDIDTTASTDEALVDVKDCAFDPDDIFEPRSTFKDGPWRGECHDTRQRRPVNFVDYTRASELQDPTGYIVINNVYHQGAFWFAFIPEGEVSQVFFQLEYFPAVVPAGHTQLRVEYRAPVILYGQSSSVKGQRDEVLDLTLSVEAVTRPGDSYDLFKGTQEHFAIAYRVTTMEARFEDMILRQNHHVEQWRLLIEDEEAEALLPHYVSESAAYQLDHSYHTLLRNCTTEIIAILDGVVRYSWREHVQRFLVKVSEIYPNIVRTALIARGLLPLDQSTDWAPLEEDEIFLERYQQAQ